MTDDAHIAHGLAGDELAPDWPPLTEAEVTAVICRYPALGQADSVVWRSPRPLSAAAIVEVAGGRVFIKRHHTSVRSPAALQEEHRFSQHLHAHGVPVPRVWLTPEGESVVHLGEWVYEAHEPARGSDTYQETFSWSPVGSAAQARTAGAMLARLHVAAEGYRAPQRKTHILVARADILSAADPLAEIENQLSQRPSLAGYLGERDWRADIGAAIAPWHASVAAVVAEQPRMWTHGDWHVSNLCWSGPDDAATITDVLDLGLSALTFALFDLATAIERNAIAWLDLETGSIAHIDLALALIEGYASVRPLDRDDLALLADLLPIVHVDFALSEVEYFEGVTRRRDHADVAWQTFLLGHAAWFRTKEGEALLSAIRRAHGKTVVQ